MQVSEFLQLSVAERIQIVENIWGIISNSSESLSLSDAKKIELDNYKQNPNEGIKWEALKRIFDLNS